MKKRLLCGLVTATLLFCVLVGCGGSSNSSDGRVTFSGGSAPEPSVSDPSGEPPAGTNIDGEFPDDYQDLGMGAPIEDPDDGLGEGVYVVTRYDINNLVANFISYACECAANGKPSYWTISGLVSNGQSMPISGSLSLLKVDSRMALDSDYEDNFFYDFLFNKVGNLAPRGNRTIRSYNVSVETDWANFYDFHYYQNTEAVLLSNVHVTINYVNANNESEDIDFYQEFKFVNETDNPEQWLILARHMQNFDRAKILTNEDGTSNNLSWVEVYRNFLGAVGNISRWNKEQDRNVFDFYDVDSDGLPEVFHFNYGMFRINQDNVPEPCEIETNEFGRFYGHPFMDAVRRYEIYTEKMNSGTAEILRAYQAIIPEDCDFDDSAIMYSSKLVVDDFGSDQVMMFFDGALYQYKDGRVAKIHDFSEFEGLDGAGIYGYSMDDGETVFYVGNSFYNAANGVYTEKMAAINAQKFTIIKTLTMNWAGKPDPVFGEGFINAFFDTEEINDAANARVVQEEFRFDADVGLMTLGENTVNVKDAYRGYIERCIDLNNPVY